MTGSDSQLKKLIESQIEELLEDDSYYDFFATTLKPAYAFKQRHRDQMRKFFQITPLHSQLEKAQSIVLNLLPDFISVDEFSKIKNEIDQSEEHFAHFIESTEDESSEKPILFQEMLGLSDETVLHMYDLAVNLVKKENYLDAFAIFVFLTTLAPHVENYWIAQGVCLQALNQHEEAVGVFTIAKLLQPSDPTPFAYLIESYRALKQKEEAKTELEALKEVVKNLEGAEQAIWKEKLTALVLYQA